MLCSDGQYGVSVDKRGRGVKVDRKSPIPSMYSKPQVHAFAEKMALGLGYAPGDPLEPLLDKIGGRVAPRDIFSDTENADSIKVDPTGRFTIYISGLASAERDRFTIAHELGHYFLHFPIIRSKYPGQVMVATRWVDDTDNIQRRAEWEANWFAAAFLMPSAAFKNSIERHARNMVLVAADFGVSVHAATVRAKYF